MDKEKIFLKNRIYPNASKLFGIEVAKLDEIKNDCIFILDTNVLLLPYTTTKESFEAIKKIYKKLIDEDRLFIPEQVAREFVSNRPEKIKDIYQNLNNVKSKLHTPSFGNYPLLGSLSDYNNILDLEKEINEKNEEYSKKLKNIANQIKKWGIEDPISIVYKELFKEKIIRGTEEQEEKILDVLSKRNEFNIPPGFKDKSKDDNGIGDLLIWLTILNIAKQENKNIVFVSADEKNDWFYKSESVALFPRFELISEFNDETSGKTFHIIKLSKLLEIFEPSQTDIIDEVKYEERRIDIEPNIRIINNIEDIIYKWLIDTEPDAQIKITARRFYSNFVLRKGSKRENIIIQKIERDILQRLDLIVNRSILDFRKYSLRGECIRYICVFNSMSDAEKGKDYVLRIKSKNEFIEYVFGYIIDDHFVEV